MYAKASEQNPSRTELLIYPGPVIHILTTCPSQIIFSFINRFLTYYFRNGRYGLLPKYINLKEIYTEVAKTYRLLSAVGNHYEPGTLQILCAADCIIGFLLDPMHALNEELLLSLQMFFQLKDMASILEYLLQALCKATGELSFSS